MSLNYRVLTVSQDSRYPQDLVFTLRFDGEAPDANGPICLIDAAQDLLEALENLVNLDQRCGWHSKEQDAAIIAIAKAKGEHK